MDFPSNSAEMFGAGSRSIIPLAAQRFVRSRLDLIEDWDRLAREAHYDVCELALRTNFSIRQIERYFLQTRKATPREWLRERQLIEAAVMLRQGIPIKQVAADAGFVSLSTFYRAFKSAYGMTPMDYTLSWSSNACAAVAD